MGSNWGSNRFVFGSNWVPIGVRIGVQFGVQFGVRIGVQLGLRVRIGFEFGFEFGFKLGSHSVKKREILSHVKKYFVKSSLL